MKAGRPEKIESERLSEVLHIRLKPDDLVIIKTASEFDGMGPAAWARDILVNVAKDIVLDHRREIIDSRIPLP